MKETLIPDPQMKAALSAADRMVDEMYADSKPEMELQLEAPHTIGEENIPAAVFPKMKYSSTHANIRAHAKRYALNELTSLMGAEDVKTLLHAILKTQKRYSLGRGNALIEYTDI
jgi:hypothetical protein